MLHIINTIIDISLPTSWYIGFIVISLHLSIDWGNNSRHWKKIAIGPEATEANGHNLIFIPGEREIEKEIDKVREWERESNSQRGNEFYWIP